MTTIFLGWIRNWFAFQLAPLDAEETKTARRDGNNRVVQTQDAAWLQAE